MLLELCADLRWHFRFLLVSCASSTLFSLGSVQSWSSASTLDLKYESQELYFGHVRDVSHWGCMIVLIRPVALTCLGRSP